MELLLSFILIVLCTIVFILWDLSLTIKRYITHISPYFQSPEQPPSNEEDTLLDEAEKLVVADGMASASLIQRRLSVGYARATRILDQLEAKGIVGPERGSQPREVLVD